MEGLRMELGSIDLHRASDGVILVRVRSEEKSGSRLPDAVFTFRRGDPQYEFWEREFQERDRQAG